MGFLDALFGGKDTDDWDNETANEQNDGQPGYEDSQDSQNDNTDD